MPTVRVEIKGLQQLGANLRELGIEMAEMTGQAAVGAAATIVKRRAIELAPEAQEVVVQKALGIAIHPGNLKKNIISKKLSKSQRDPGLTSQAIVAVRSGKKAGYASRYGSMLEYGTVKMSARSYMRKAFEQEKVHAKDVMLDVIKGVIDEVQKRGI